MASRPRPTTTPPSGHVWRVCQTCNGTGEIMARWTEKLGGKLTRCPRCFKVGWIATKHMEKDKRQRRRPVRPLSLEELLKDVDLTLPDRGPPPLGSAVPVSPKRTSPRRSQPQSNPPIQRGQTYTSRSGRGSSGAGFAAILMGVEGGTPSQSPLPGGEVGLLPLKRTPWVRGRGRTGRRSRSGTGVPGSAG